MIQPSASKASRCRWRARDASATSPTCCRYLRRAASGCQRPTRQSPSLFVHKAALHTPSPPEVIAKTYKLTPSELRVLLAIIQVAGVSETADALGISENTVKTHLRRLFDKTGTGRQADLVKLVAGFSNPLVH